MNKSILGKEERELGLGKEAGEVREAPSPCGLGRGVICKIHAPVRPSWWLSCTLSRSPWPKQCSDSLGQPTSRSVKGYELKPTPCTPRLRWWYRKTQTQPKTQGGNEGQKDCSRVVSRGRVFTHTPAQSRQKPSLTSWQMELISAPEILSGLATSVANVLRKPIPAWQG